MTSITIEQDALIVHFKATLLEKLSDEDRDKLLERALTEVLNVNLTKGEFGRTMTWGQDAMRIAMGQVCQDICVEILNEPTARAKLSTAIRTAIDKAVESIEANLEKLITENIKKGIEKATYG